MRIALSAALGLVLSLTLTAQHQEDYEKGFLGTPAGTKLTGQQKYYIPPNTTSVDFNVHTYVQNSYGFPQNPNGGNFFVAASGPGGGTFGRAQKDVSWGLACGKWTVGFDICGSLNRMGTAGQNLGSFSVQAYPAAKSFIALARWTTPATPTTWNADFVVFNSAGAQVIVVPGNAGFQNLSVKKWYRWETDFDLTTNAILETRITDIVAKTTSTFKPTGWYVANGPNSTLPKPSGYRWFAGGSAATANDNTLGFDNLVISHTDVASSSQVFGSNGAGSFSVLSGKPVVGQTIDLGVDDPSGTLGAGASSFLLFGLGRANIPTPFGALLTTLLPGISAVGPKWTGKGNPAKISLKIPLDCNLIGGAFVVQGALLQIPKGAKLSDAAELTVGEK